MNLACVGARPLGLVNCLNFGNPEHPEVMWQLSEAIDGMAEACRAFGIPVVGGNVSLYNESGGRDIDPTPVVGIVGLVDRLDQRPPGVRLVEGGTLLALGARARSLSGSRWAWERGHQAGPPPGARPRRRTPRSPTSCAALVAEGLLAGVHDTADGLGLALAEMAVRSRARVRRAGDRRRPRVAVRRVAVPGRRVRRPTATATTSCGPRSRPACRPRRLGRGRRAIASS